MKSVSISYNPYKLTTHITVDGNELKENSKLRERSAEGNRLQEWVEDLPDMLLNEFNDKKFAVSFHGTIMDYEDLKEVLDEAQEQNKFLYNLKWEKAQEAADKEKLIDEVFAEIQEGPFKELKSDEIKTAFQNAKSNDFEVCVVATMSAGKSTLINAMLGKELMPSKAGACTAMITRIKDVDQLEDSFRAEVYRKGRISETYENLDYSIMNRLNEDDTVDEVRVYGNMPFVSSDDLSLVLVDTPGPNNARDDSHEEVQQNALGKSSKALVLYIMTNEYGTDDDEITLRRVAKTMSVGGKQSKDRFLFVVNKMDSRRTNDGSTEETLDQVREYLKAQGINNPNLFPAAALPALNIRRMKSEEVDEEIEEETEFLIGKLNRNERLHLEKYASLPGGIKDDIEENLKKTQEEWKKKGGERNKNPEEALIHTGVTSIEAAIRQYVEKYAKTARIKNIVDTFQHKLEELNCIENTTSQLEKYREEWQNINKHIENEKNRITDIKEVQKFSEKIDNNLKALEKDGTMALLEIKAKCKSQITQKGARRGKEKIELSQVKTELLEWEKFCKGEEKKFKTSIDDLMEDILNQTGNMLVKEYKNKLKKLAFEIPVNGKIDKIKIDPFTMLKGSFVPENFSVDEMIKEEKVEDGEEWVKNTGKKWYKPWTWFQEDGYWRKKYSSHKYIEYTDFFQEYEMQVENAMNENLKSASNYLLKQKDNISKQFEKAMKSMNDELIEKLSEFQKKLVRYDTGKEDVEKAISKTQKRIDWLQNIQDKVNTILES